MVGDRVEYICKREKAENKSRLGQKGTVLSVWNDGTIGIKWDDGTKGSANGGSYILKSSFENLELKKKKEKSEEKKVKK